MLSQIAARRRLWERASVLLCLAAALAPFVLPEIPIGADLPKHLFVARVYSAFDDPSFRFSEYFDLSPRPVPTFLVTFLLAAAMKVVAPFTAAKLFLVAATLGLWYSARGLFRAVGAPGSAALLVLPLSNSGFVFSGLLGYIASVAVYPALLCILAGRRRGAIRFCAIAAVLLVLYGFHVVGYAVGCLTVAVFACAPLVGIEPGTPRRSRIHWLDLAAPAATVPLFLFFTASGSQSSPAFWYGPLGQVKALFGYTVLATTRSSAIPLMAGILALLVAVSYSVWRGRADLRFLLAGGILLLAGVVLPWEYRAWSPVAPRVLPLALIALMGGLRLAPGGWRVAAASAVLVMLPLGAINTRAVLDEQSTYREFMAGIPSVAFGSRVLPVIEHWDAGWGNPVIGPHYGLEDTYNLARGGSNPLVFAAPHLKTGAHLLTYRQVQPKAEYKYDTRLVPDSTGASDLTDYVVLFGLRGQREVLAREMDICYSGGRLAVFGRRGKCVR